MYHAPRMASLNEASFVDPHTRWVIQNKGLPVRSQHQYIQADKAIKVVTEMIIQGFHRLWSNNQHQMINKEFIIDWRCTD